MTTASHSRDVALSSLFHNAHTPGGFVDTPIDDSLITAAYETARWAPTAFNSQPMRLVMANSPAAREAVVTAARDANKDRLRAAPQVAVIAADLEFNDHLLELNPYWKAVPEILDDPARRQPLAVSQTWLQAGYLITALRAEGLAVAPMTGLDLPSLTDGLLRDMALQAVLVLAIGHPDPEAKRPRANRLDAETAITWL